MQKHDRKAVCRCKQRMTPGRLLVDHDGKQRSLRWTCKGCGLTAVLVEQFDGMRWKELRRMFFRSLKRET